MAGALEGIKVLELANYVSGPFAGVLLSDLGADVIKIEEPKHGDPFRGWGAAEYSPTFGSVNRNKKSVTLDLKSKEGLETALRLADQADVLIENFRTGTLERLGLGYDVLAKRNPRLIYCSITGFGRTGPYANRPGYDTVGQAMSGLLGLLTDRSAPQPMGISLSDHLTGMVASYGILGALMARTRTGKGQRVETSLLQATMSLLGENAARYFENGEVPARATRARSAQVFGFVGSDGKPFVVHLSSPPKFWEGLANVVGHPDGSRKSASSTRMRGARPIRISTRCCRTSSPPSPAIIGCRSCSPPTCRAARSTISTKCSRIPRSSILACASMCRIRWSARSAWSAAA